ncbi:MAG: NAD-dependent DNA ligase LigA [Clostridia bacterium]
MSNVLEEMQALVDDLNYHAKQYYKLDKPVISDGEYDKMYDKLVLLENEAGFSLPNSPTKRVGGEIVAEFKQYKHTHKLYSLDKCQSISEFYVWYAKTEKSLGEMPELSVEYKFDGLTLNMVYENGMLISAATRGNGEVGEEVTEQVKTIKNIPLSIDYKGHIEIQGEGIMKLSVLKSYNEMSVDQLKNARNAAAGAIRNLNPKVTADRKLDVMCYNVFGDVEFSTQLEMQEFLNKHGFETGDYFKLLNNPQEVENVIETISKCRDDLDFLIDGIVFKLNNVHQREMLGETEKFPRWAVAYKFEADEATTLVKDVIWQVSRTSRLCPLAILEPVDLAGVTVQRATLNNFADLQKKDIKIGSRVFIRRSNDVIPEILGIAEHTENTVDIIKPDKCPYCGSPIRAEGAFLYCTNTETCVPQIVAKLSHFASKGAMDIDGFSEKTAELLYVELGVAEFSDLYELSAEKLVGLEGFAELKTQNLLLSISKSKLTSLANFIYALGIKNIGKKAAKQLEISFSTLENIMKATIDDLVKVDDFGEITANNVVDYFTKPENIAQINKLISLGITFNATELKTGIFSGKNVVLTGSLQKYKRSEAEKIIVELGGVISSTISKSVNLVIVGEEAGSKLAKAEKLAIEIIDENAFDAILKSID